MVTVISFIRDAESVLILGPGEAKTELKRRLEIHKLAGRIATIETAHLFSLVLRAVSRLLKRCSTEANLTQSDSVNQDASGLIRHRSATLLLHIGQETPKATCGGDLTLIR